MDLENATNKSEATPTEVPKVEAVDQSSQVEEAKPEPTPTAEKVETKPEEVEKKDEGQGLDFFLKRIERKEAARDSVLRDEYKILKPEYMALAPSSEHADPTSEEGREALRQWVNANPGLFGRAPDLPQAEDTGNQKSIFSNRGWTWADKWRDAQ